ncbi:xylosyltransferase oxt [Anthonomus grandis grandis]|uniref:xylosyltransferase oxt n=1 Tax=Anthonomus grandis grandis TaxID=2921223 RepID=UPI002166A617|nr:xylosyltransferase oxt [Anthonomus grandis grandis]
MVKSSPKNKYLRRYRTCFIIGIVILSFQILLVANFFAQNKNSLSPETWEPSDLERDSGSFNEALNSARRSDDEETNLLAPQVKKAANISLMLKLEELNIELPCQITEKQALSALNRAKSQKCRQIIANISCLNSNGQLYPQEIQSTCPNKNYVKGKQLGCYKDEKNFRILTGYMGVNKNENSPKYCINLCLQSGFPYAGVQYSQECFCGSDSPPLSSKIPDSSCNMKCPGDPHETCGGYFTINIYQTGIKKFVPQTANNTTNELKSTKIVFLLTLNGRALRQVIRLLKNIYHREHYYYIHVDIRQDYLFRELLSLESFPNIRLTRNRFATIWGGASLLQMLLSCMKEVLAIPEWDWQFIVNLSESDLPVKRIDKLSQFLSANKGMNFVKSHGREAQRFLQKQGLDKTFVECEYRMWRVGNRKLPAGIQVDGGSDWLALSRPFVEYVTSPQPDEVVQGLVQVFRHTLLPAESFFHTVLRNSKFCDTYIDNNLHVTNWKRKLGCKCQYKHIVDWCGCSPNDFTSDDWTKILNTQTRPLYFARKFEAIVNQAVILQLELWLHNLDTPSKQVANLNSYWQNIYHHKDLGVPFDDALTTFSNSIARHTAKTLPNSCPFTALSPLLQVHTYHRSDIYRSTLFLYKDIEVAVKPISKLLVAVKSSPLLDHLSYMLVSSDYDQKEQMSRNFLRLLSPFSEPVLAYKFNPVKISKQYNLTCLWIDPVGNLRDTTLVSVDENNLSGHSKPALKQPILPGTWQVKLLYKDTLLAQLTFPIIPLEFYYGKPLTGDEMLFLHSSLANPGISEQGYTKFLPNETEKQMLNELANKNAQKQGEQLLKWIDSVVDAFFSVETVCGTDETDNKCDKVCRTTEWSSLAPDPKSAIGKVNSTTGMFDVW